MVKTESAPLSPEQLARFNANVGLVYAFVAKLRLRHASAARVEKQDAIQAGMIGLLKATRRFNGCEQSWSSYVFFYVRQAIQEEARRATVVKGPTHATQGKGFGYNVATCSFGEGEDDSPEPADHRHRDLTETMDLVRPALASLRNKDPRLYRAVLWKYIEEKEEKEVGEAMGKCRSRANQMIKEGLEKLRRIIAKRMA